MGTGAVKAGRKLIPKVPNLVAVEPEALSPNQVAKRRQIVAAAQQVILREGPARCTTREVARESGINQGLIYYYFESHEEIIDTAMEGFADELAAAIVKAKDEHEVPTERFWALFENYLGLYERPGLAAAWFEYLMISARSGRAEKVAKVEDRVIELLTEVLEEAGAADAPVRARLVVSYIIGVLIRSFTNPHTVEELRPEIARLAP